MDAPLEANQPLAVADQAVVFRSFLNKVFAWMVAALAITGVISFAIEGMVETRMNAGAFPGWWLWGAVIAQLVVVMILSFGINKISPAVATLLFFAYAALTGVTFGVIFSFYADGVVAAAFLATCLMFATLAAIGWTTKADLTRWGPILFGALIAMLISSLIGMFFSLAFANFVMLWGGLLIFMAFTIYDVNRMKKQNIAGKDGGLVQKAAIFGALQLYLDFINIFIRLLAIFGGNR